LEAASNILISDVGFLVGVFWAVDLEGGRSLEEDFNYSRDKGTKL
jgi:hypothetical protein